MGHKGGKAMKKYFSIFLVIFLINGSSILAGHSDSILNFQTDCERSFSDMNKKDQRKLFGRTFTSDLLRLQISDVCDCVAKKIRRSIPEFYLDELLQRRLSEKEKGILKRWTLSCIEIPK